MKKLYMILAVGAISPVFAGCNYTQHPEESSDKALISVLEYNKQHRGHDDQMFIAEMGDSSLGAFNKEVETVPHVDSKPDVGVRYTSIKHHWSYYVARESKNVYSLTYCTDSGGATLLRYRVNVVSGVVEASI